MCWRENYTTESEHLQLCLNDSHIPSPRKMLILEFDLYTWADQRIPSVPQRDSPQPSPHYHVVAVTTVTSKRSHQREAGSRGELKHEINRKREGELDFDGRGQGKARMQEGEAHSPARENRELEMHKYPNEDYANEYTDYRDMYR